MKSIICLLLVAVSLVAAQTISLGIAKIKGTTNDPNIVGTVTFNQVGDLVNITAYITNITVAPGIPHGLHVHEFGDLAVNTGASVGGHWNPYGAPHGCPENASRHLGDTGNWEVVDGVVNMWKTINMQSLTGNNSVIGFAVIFHANTDDCFNISSSGSRLAQGVIGVANPTYYSATANAALPPNYYTGVTNAVCNLQVATGTGISGWVRFSQPTPADPVVVTANISGLVVGTTHGFHIHQYGDFSTQDALSAGNHYTGPIYDSTAPHSIPGSGRPKHVGDMGNIYFYDANGFAYYNASYTEFGLYGSVNNIIGRAVIVHEKGDNCSQPLGAAGTRYAICIIGPANPAYLTSYVINTAVSGLIPIFQNSTDCGAQLTTAPATTAPLTTMGVATTAAAESSSFGVRSSEVSIVFVVALALIAYFY